MLTKRETQVAQLVAQGLSRREMAAELSITVSAIDKLVHALKAKLGAPSHAALVLRCAEEKGARRQVEAGRTEGPLLSQPALAPEERAPPPQPGGFDPSRGIDGLVRQLEEALAGLGVTHLAYSHIRAAAPGEIRHLASRWTLPPGVAYDADLAPSDNPTFAYAMTSWQPLPLDLAAIQADPAYHLVPERIRRQHDHYVAADLLRGITFPLPGLGLHDRLVLSVILRHASAARFAEVVAGECDRMRLIALDFRNAHVSLAQPRVRLTDREAGLLDGLADGLSLEAAGAVQGISRRAAERCLASAREALGIPTTPALVAAHLRNRSEPVLPF